MQYSPNIISNTTFFICENVRNELEKKLRLKSNTLYTGIRSLKHHTNLIMVLVLEKNCLLLLIKMFLVFLVADDLPISPYWWELLHTDRLKFMLSKISIFKKKFIELQILSATMFQLSGEKLLNKSIIRDQCEHNSSVEIVQLIYWKLNITWILFGWLDDYYLLGKVFFF